MRRISLRTCFVSTESLVLGLMLWQDPLTSGGLRTREEPPAMSQYTPRTMGIRRQFATPAVSRRGFLRGAGLAGLGLGVPGLLSACGPEGAQQSADSCVSKDLSAS